MEIGKALILAGNPHADWALSPGNRHLFPVGNRPILFHNLEALRASGVLEATILAEHEETNAIRDAVGDGSDWNLAIGYADWHWSAGLCGALEVLGDVAGDAPVLVEQGDALLRDQIQPHVSAFVRERLDVLALRLKQSARAASELTTGYLFSPRAIEMLRESGTRVVEPIDGVRERGGRVGVAHVRGCLPCHGDVDALLESNRCVLEGFSSADYAPDSLDGDATTVQGPVRIHPSAQISRSLLRGPLVIGPGARISDAYIGPYTSIGADVVVEAAEIEHSIVLAGAELRFIGTRLESSVIGRGARVVRRFEPPASLRMALGDGAEVFLK